jgi:hypothetical protein
MNFKINVEKVASRSFIDRACSFTEGKGIKVKDYKKMYLSEHSPIRTQLFWVEMLNIPTFVSVHLVRHKIGVEHYVRSNRKDRGGDSNADRNTPINHAMLINAQALINISKDRLCFKASKETRGVVEAIKEAVRQVDPELAECMIKKCEYRGKCHEFKSCGYFANSATASKCSGGQRKEQRGSGNESFRNN